MKNVILQNKKFIKALKILAKKLTKKVNWVLAGSCSLALQGVKVKPKDIDILTDKNGAIKINKLLKKYTIKPVRFKSSKNFRSYFGKFRIGCVKVEVMGNLEEKIKNKWVSLVHRLKAKRFIKIDKIKIPVSPLEDQLRFYRNSKRKKDLKRVQKIKEALKIK